MKILQINATYSNGSTGTIVKEIHKLCEEERIESYVAYATSSVKPTDIVNGYKIGNRLDSKLHALFARIIGLQGYNSVFATYKLLRHIDKIKPDIINLHNLHSNFINIPMIFKYIKKRKIKTLITLHDCWFFTGKCSHFLYDGCDGYLHECGNCPRLSKDIPSFIFDRTRKMLKDKKRLIGHNPYVYVAGCSYWITEEAKKSILKERKTYTLYTGIDLDTFRGRESELKKSLGLENKCIILGFAGKWLSKDNKETFEAVKKSLDDNTVLLLLGCNKEQMALLGGKVVGAPFIKDKNLMAEYYSIADMFVNVTKADTLPMVNMESLACGTPVVTYDSGGSGELVPENGGFIVPYGDYNKLIEKIKKVKSDGKDFYSQHCINHARENFDNKKRFLKYIEVYRSLGEE